MSPSALLAELKERELPSLLPLGEIRCAPTRNALLKVLYETGVVEAAPFSAHAADKLFFARLVEALLPEDRFHPKTRSLTQLFLHWRRTWQLSFPRATW